MAISIGTCPSCPSGKEYDQYRNSEAKFGYEEGVGIYNDVDVTIWDCPDCLNKSTVDRNIFDHSYAGPENPLSNDDNYNYSVWPTSLADYPAIGHDRSYDALGITGLQGVLLDTRAIGADWQFVFEEMVISTNLTVNFDTRVDAGVFAIGMAAAILPKTVYKLAQPRGGNDIVMWYMISRQGVTNRPSKPAINEKSE